MKSALEAILKMETDFLANETFFYLHETYIFLLYPFVRGDNCALDNTCKTHEEARLWVININVKIRIYRTLIEDMHQQVDEIECNQGDTLWNNIQDVKNVLLGKRDQLAIYEKVLNEILPQNDHSYINPADKIHNFIESCKPCNRLADSKRTGTSGT